MSTPYHVRLAVSQYGEQFRAELFTEDLGDTEGDLLAALPPSIAEWVPYLAQGADLPPDAARQLGKDLFAALLGQPENAKKWAEVLAQAARKGQTVRLLIDATTEAVRDLPYGLLCEPHDDWFLFHGGQKLTVAFVRILRRCSPRPLQLNARLRVLVAVAEPTSADVPPFDAPRRLQKLAAAVHKDVDLIICGPAGPKVLAEIAPNPEAAALADFGPYTKTTRDALRTVLAGEYDVFHLLAHGQGAGVLLCSSDGGPAETTASELAEWCGVGRTSLAFLQVCKAGQTAGRGGFGGVAQQLLNPRGGNLAAVVASTFPLDAEHSTDAAVGFYRQLAAGKSPEQSLTADRPETDWCWAFLELWARPGALGGTEQRAAFQFVSPYRGLSSFGEQDADLFFGRKMEVAELLQILRTEPAVAVVGDSGSGKTSLLQAGLVHAIRREGLAGSDKWKIASLRPGYRPAQALLAALTGSTGEPTPEALATVLRVDLQPLVIVFDQFEEVFTLARDKAEVQMLTAALADAVEARPDRFRLVIGMRSEFLGQAASVRGLSRLVRRPWVLRPPNADDLREIVGGPAEHCGYTFQGPLIDGNSAHAIGLLDRILADPLLARDTTGATAAPLPLLQFALERLWLKAVEKGLTEFTHAEFDGIGGMGKAIAQHAESVFQEAPAATALGAQARPLAEQIITALVSTHGTRQPRGREALQTETGSPDAARAVVDYLVGERLLTVRSDPEDMTKSLVDLSHEALIQYWDRLRGWLAEDPQGRAMREQFRTAAEQWENGFAGVPPRSRYGLPGADVARNYLAWIGTSAPKLSPVQHEFATALRDMVARERRRRRLVTGALAGLALASSALALYADGQAGRARLNEEAAQTSADEARTSADAAKASAARAEAEKARAVQQKRLAEIQAATLAFEKGIQVCEEGRPRLGLLAIAYSLHICPRDATDLRRVILTNLAAWGPHLMSLDEIHTFSNPILATDPTGAYVLLQLPKGPGEKTDEAVPNPVQLFDTDTEKPVGPPVTTQWLKPDGGPGVRYPVTRAAVLPNGVVLISGLGHSSVWDMKTGTQIGKTIGHGVGVTALSPDGKLVAAPEIEGARTDNLRLYDVATGIPRAAVLPHRAKVYAVTFSSDGSLLATGCGRNANPQTDKQAEKKDALNERLIGGTVHLFEIGPDAKSESKIRWAHGFAYAVTGVAISPDGKQLTEGGFELRSWKITARGAKDDGELIGTRPNPESISQIAFDPTNTKEYIACNPSGSLQVCHRDDALRLAGERLSPQGWLAGTGYRPDGRIFTANSNGVVRVWRRPPHDASALARDQQFAPPNTQAVLSVAFRSDGKAIALGTKTGLVYLYHLDPAGPRKEFRCSYDPHAERRPVEDVRFSPDGRRIVAHDAALNVFVFDSNGEPDPLRGKVRPLGVGADGRTAIVSLANREYQLWQAGAPDAPLPSDPKFTLARDLAVVGDEADDGLLLRASRTAVTPDRALVALLDRDGAVHLFRTASGERVCPPIRHLVDGAPDAVRSVAFSPEGELLLTRSAKARGMWDARTGAEIHLLSNRIGIQVTRFSSSGRQVLGGTDFSTVRVWDRTGREVRSFPTTMHNGQVWGVGANPAETRIVTASSDRSARIWDLATGRPLSPPLLHRQGVSDAVFSPDGTRVLTGSWDGTARLWAVPEPLPDDPDRVVAWVQTITGLKVGPNASGDLLEPEEWLESKRELDRRGGPPLAAIP